nr:MAG TPA: hypothetical protein [Bacteriophage sp.]
MILHSPISLPIPVVGIGRYKGYVVAMLSV